MGLTVQIHQAAHQYSLDNLDVNTLYKTLNDVVLGKETSTTNSWIGSLLPGQTGEVTSIYANGFTARRSVENIDGVTGKITAISIYKTDLNTLLLQTSGDILFPLPIVGAALDNQSVYAADDVLAGNDFNNALRGYAGNDVINGYGGIDTAYFSGFWEDYSISVIANNLLAISGTDGSDKLASIERIRFDDRKVAFDLNGNAGIAAKVAGAVFGKDSLKTHSETGVFLALLDSGLDYSSLMQFALTTKLGSGFSNSDEVKLLYQNLLGSQPSDAETKYWTDRIDSGEFTPVSLALMAAETGINSQNIKFEKLIKTGLEYANTNSAIISSSQNAVDSLLGSYKWGDGMGSGIGINYSFRTDASEYSTDSDAGYGPIDGPGEPWQEGWKILTATQMDSIRSSLAAWAEVANVRFKEVTDSTTVSGDIRFSALTGMTDSKTYLPDLTTRGGDVWLDATDNLSTVSKGTYGYVAFLRESGHALGLDNPHEGQVVADPAIDALPFTVMSQRDFIGDTLNNKRDILYPTTPMLNDIAAIQYLYGANSATRSGDTIYGWAPDQAIFETLWDGGGNDTIDWSTQTTAAIIDLNAGAWSNLGPERWDGHVSTNQNLAIAFNTVIENAAGGTADDKLTGNSSSNFLHGGDGNDEMHGGSDADFFDWDSNLRGGNDVMYGGLGNDAFVMNTALDSVVELPEEGIDTIWSTETYSIVDVANVENLYLFGTKQTDAKGNTLDNELRGNVANNLLEGGEGNDTLMGGAGQNTLDGGEGADTAVYLLAKDSYVMTPTDTGWRIENSLGDTDTLAGIERLRFLDTNIAYDLNGNAGTVARIIGAIFGKESLDRKDYVGIGLKFLDSGMSYAELMDLALSVKLGTGYSDADEVNLLYANLIGSKPSGSDLNYWTSTISSGQFTQNSLAIMAADHEINTTNIDLVGLAQTGILYY